MKRRISGSIFTIVILMVAVVFSGCDWLIPALLAPYGYVIDARTGDGVSNVTVTFTPIAVDEGIVQSIVTATTNTDGYFSRADLNPGTYAVSASKTGYVFMPITVSITGWNENIGDLYGVTSSSKGDSNAVSVFLTWNSDYADMDAYLTYPTAFINDDTSLGAGNPDPYYDIGAEIRNTVYWNDEDGDGILDGADLNTSSDKADAFASIDVDDVDGSGPETISIIGLNTGAATDIGSYCEVSSSTPYVGGVLPAGDYYYMGAAVYYIDAYSSPTNLDGKGAKVVIAQGDQIKGTFAPMSDMAQDTVSVFRAMLFYTSNQAAYYLVFVPDYRIADSASGGTGYPPVGVRSVPENQIFVVTGAK